MKNKFLFLFSSILLSINSSYSQWAPIGATWHTGIIESISSPNQGFIRTNSIGDTVVNSINCKLLESVHVNSTGQVVSVDSLFIYSDSGKVYHYRNGSFYVLYDFTLNPGDTWQTLAPYPSPFTLSGNPPDTIVEIVVDSVSTIIISGISKRVMYVHSNLNDWYFWNPIIEDIGSAGGLFPFIYDWMDFEIPLLRCYNDSVLQYDTELNFPCDTLLNSVENFEKSNLHEVVLYPVPVNDRLNFHFNTSEEIKSFLLYDDVGRLMMKGDKDALNMGIQTNNFSSGFYYIWFQTDLRAKSVKFVISHP